MCSDKDTGVLTGVQLQLYLPEELSEKGTEERMLLYGYGNLNKAKMDCEYLYLARDEIVSAIFLRHGSTVSRGL